MRRIVTDDLYKAAFYVCRGAKVINAEGTYPKVGFLLEMSYVTYFLAKIPFESWKKLRKKRKFLKEAALTGIYHKRTFGDEAKVKVK